uniref:Sodium/potassium-transporting ATPase subunit beta-1-interacting protein n=1 Tax=Cacopsylla melanoneura TaxID=428564 RepID=A0A8D8TW09_9HEMI
MGFCSKRFNLLLLCTLQFMTTSVRQIFDFLGFMWAPILMNFFLLLFTIFGFFGACQYKTKYILSNSDILNFGTGSVSWWESSGPRCKAIFHANKSSIEEDPFRPVRPDLITGCVLDYQYVESLQACVQIILSIIGASIGLTFRKDILNGDDDDEFGFLGSFGAQVNPHHVALHPIST